jgi:hypothetical protein
MNLKNAPVAVTFCVSRGVRILKYMHKCTDNPLPDCTAVVASQ